MNIKQMDYAPSTIGETFSLGSLHLKLRTYKMLNELRITTVGELIQLNNENFKGLRLTPTAIKDVQDVIGQLHRSQDDAGHVNWFDFWRGLGLTLLPRSYKMNSSPEQILRLLPTIIKEVLSHNHETDKRWRTIQRRFGLEGTKEITLDEIGTALNLTRERVRQIESRALTELKECLLENQYVGKTYHVYPEIVDLTKRLFDAVATESKEFVLETELLERCQKVIGSSLGATDHSVLFLLFQLFGLSRVKIDTFESTSIWEYGDTGRRNLLQKAIKLIDELLTKEHTAAMDEFDILVKLNSRLSNLQKIDMLTLHKFLELCGSVEKVSGGLFQGKFEFLTRGAQAERVLTEANKPLHVEELAREINNRLVSQGKKKVQILNISNIMSSDERFVAVGSSGQRGLKKWEDLEAGSIVDVMEKCLMTLNRPATEVEIYSYVAERRPVSQRSIRMYLDTKTIFKKADRQRWGLSSWVETKDALIWSPVQVADFVANIFKQKKTRKLEFKFITEALKQAAGVNASEATGMLKFNPVISSRREEKPFKVFAIFNPNYKKSLEQLSRPQRKSETRLQRANTVVREMLEGEASNQIELSKLVQELKLKHGFHEKTAYQYISRMEFIEKIDLPDSGVRICRLNGNKKPTFPQLDTLKTLDTAKAEEAERAVANLTLDDVDIGLFMLGRLFENTLKDFMMKVEATQSYPVGPGNYSKLNNMIQWVESQGIVSDKTTLNFLKLERNERAHGTLPTLKEREMMLNASPWMASLYLDQIVHFSEKAGAVGQCGSVN